MVSFRLENHEMFYLAICRRTPASNVICPHFYFVSSHKQGQRLLDVFWISLQWILDDIVWMMQDKSLVVYGGF